MKNVLAALIVVGGATPSMAEDVSLAYEAVMQVREVQSIEVLDRPEHSVGVGKFRGLAILPDDSVIVHRYEGWFDLVQGSGAFHGYALWEFGDGSTLRAAYEGEALDDGPNNIRVGATFHDFEGTGRFEGVAGTGEFAGRRLDALEDGGATHVLGTLNLTLPD